VPLKISRRGGEGITVPYAPIFDAVRKNRGFEDVRGRPDLAAEIAEGIESRALGECLVRIAKENLYFSLGCDLGNHHDPEQPAPLRQVAGGCIEVTSINYASATTDQLDAFSLAFGSRLKRLSGVHHCSMDLNGKTKNRRNEGLDLIGERGLSRRAVQRSLLNLMEKMDLRPPSAAA